MKISQFNTNTACNIPRVLSLRDPFTGEVLKDESGKTLDFWVYGAHSDQARNASKNRDRQKDADNAEQVGAEFLASLTQGWSGNIEDDNGPIEFSFKNAVNLYLNQDWIALQVLTFSQNLGNYDPKRYRKSADGSGSEPGSTPRRKGKEPVEGA